MAKTPSYTGSGLVNLIAEIEYRLTGESPAPGLDSHHEIPDASTYVLILFDGLGMAQTEHRRADAFRSSLASRLEAPFPTTTSVSLATVATGLPPSQHGQVAHLSWMPDLGKVVNTLKWVDLTGEHVATDYPGLLPSPNLWERLRSKGVEPITVQPGDFSGSPLSRALYRGARFEPAWDEADIVTATAQLASTERRLIFTYLPHVDFAGHVFGLESDEFSDAMGIATDTWERLAASLPPQVALIGTADHGLLEFEDDQKHLIRDSRYDELRFAGDTRGVQVWGDGNLIRDLAHETGSELVDPLPLLGPDPTGPARSRVGESVLLPADDRVLLPRGFDKRLRCYHGGISEAEVSIPLLIA